MTRRSLRLEAGGETTGSVQREKYISSKTYLYLVCLRCTKTEIKKQFVAVGTSSVWKTAGHSNWVQLFWYCHVSAFLHFCLGTYLISVSEIEEAFCWTFCCGTTLLFTFLNELYLELGSFEWLWTTSHFGRQNYCKHQNQGRKREAQRSDELFIADSP